MQRNRDKDMQTTWIRVGAGRFDATIKSEQEKREIKPTLNERPIKGTETIDSQNFRADYPGRRQFVLKWLQLRVVAHLLLLLVLRWLWNSEQEHFGSSMRLARSGMSVAQGRAADWIFIIFFSRSFVGFTCIPHSDV